MGVEPVAPMDAHNFGKYTLVAKLATGGMAEIFLARLKGAAGFEKLVCVKRILPHLAKDQQLVTMFLAEARLAAQISHANVCQVFELGEIEGRYFISMEYLEGVPFSCFRRRDIYAAHPDPRLVAGLGVQACEGLHHAHQLKKPDGTPVELVHRDVSSNNLFLTTDGMVKVLDFGIAKAQDASVRTSTGSVKGTYAYMSPEQLRGEPLDRRSDVFALGTVLWELFARRHLFKRDTEFLTFQAITTDAIADVREFRPDVPEELAGVIACALSRDRNARFPTARAMGDALAYSVLSLGGAFAPSHLSDEIAHAFESRLTEQRDLIRIAREGGSLSLDDDLGPSVGHGTEMVATPTSSVSFSTDPEVSPRFPTHPPPGPRSGPMAIPPGPRSAPMAIPAGPRSSPTPIPSVVDRSGAIALPAAPQSRTSSALRILVIALVGLVGGGAGVYFYLRSQQPPPAASSSAPAPTPTQVAAVTDRPVIDAAVPAVATAPVDAAAASEPTDAAPAPSVDTAIAAALAKANEDKPPQTGKLTNTPKPRPASKAPPKPAVVTGPPGFITIDSSPVYAVIFIDGKSYGETPLVKIQLSPGKHSVRAVSASGSVRKLSVSIEPGKVAPTRRIEW